jgi:cytochrome c oxidase subunit 1
LWSKKVGVAQAWLWFVGMALFSRDLHLVGILGAPRRTPLGAVLYASPDWQAPLALTALGGAILFVSGVLLFTNILVTVFAGKRLPVEEIPDMPVAEAVSGAEEGPAWLSDWKLWLGVTFAIILVAYGPILYESFRISEWTSPGFTLWETRDTISPSGGASASDPPEKGGQHA